VEIELEQRKCKGRKVDCTKASDRKCDRKEFDERDNNRRKGDQDDKERMKLQERRRRIKTTNRQIDANRSSLMT